MEEQPKMNETIPSVSEVQVLRLYGGWGWGCHVQWTCFILGPFDMNAYRSFIP